MKGVPWGDSVTPFTAPLDVPLLLTAALEPVPVDDDAPLAVLPGVERVAPLASLNCSAN